LTRNESGPGVGTGLDLRRVLSIGRSDTGRRFDDEGVCAVSGRAGIDAATIQCKLGIIAAGRTVTITIHAPTYTQSGIKLVERPSVVSNSIDPNPTNNGNGLPLQVPLRAKVP